MTIIKTPTPFPSLQQLLDVVQPKLAAAVKAKAGKAKAKRRGSGNLPGALKRVCRHLNIGLDASADTLLGPGLEASLKRLHHDATLPAKLRNNMTWALRNWQALLDQAYPGLLAGITVVAPSKPPRLTKLSDVLRTALRTSGLSVKEVCKRTGVKEQTFRRWLDGRALPDGRSEADLRTVERALGLADGSLTPFMKQHRSRRASQATAAGSQWSITSRSQVRGSVPTLRDSDIPETVRAAWRALVHERAARRAGGKGLMAKGWTLNAVKSATRRPAWYCEVDGKTCPTAHRYWNAARGFLAFTRADTFMHAMGTDASHLTLAWLAVPQAVRAYAQAMLDELDGVVNGTVAGFVSLVSLMCGEDGWVRRHGSLLGEQLPTGHRPGDWSAACDLALADLHDLVADHDPAERDWSDFLQPYLEHQDPATPVLAAIAQLMREADAMRPQSMDRARLLRDAALLSMQLLAPLRRRTLASLEVRSAANHVTIWHDQMTLKIPKRILKNGGARGDLKTAVQGDLVHVIRRYIDEARPVLCSGTASPWLFVSSRNPGEYWHGVSVQIAAVTARLCPLGIPAHMFRHLVAVRFLRQHPQDYLGVASLLYDSLETVLKRYAPKDPTAAFVKNSASLRLPR